MIEQKIHNLVDDFKERWALSAQSHPVFLLDGTWPSLGVVDQLTFGLRGVEDLLDFEKEIVRGAAAYMAVMAHECWTAFGAEPSVSLGNNGVVIHTDSGPFIGEGESFSVEVEVALRKILLQTPLPFPVFSNFQRYVPQEYNIISLFGIGLMTGLCPFGKGAWLAVPPENFKQNIDEVTKILARQSSEFYGRIYPNESLGQVAELYLSGLVFPPALMDEPVMGLNASNGMSALFEEYGFDHQQTIPVLEHLAQSPDELISTASFSYLCGLIEEVPSMKVLAAGQRLGGFLGVLRRSMVSVRQHIHGHSDWLLGQQVTPEAMSRFEFELTVGFLPWVKLRPSSLNVPGVFPLVKALSEFELDQSMHLLNKLVEESPQIIILKVQQAYLELLKGDIEKACSICASAATEMGADQEPQLFNNWGLLEIARGNVQEGTMHLQKSYQVSNAAHGDFTNRESAEVANNYGWALMQNGDLTQALKVLDQSIELGKCPLTSLLNKSFILRELEDEVALARVEKTLLDLAPMDRRVFSNLMITTLHQRGLIEVEEEGEE